MFQCFCTLILGNLLYGQNLPHDNGPYGGIDCLKRVLSIGENEKVPLPRKDRFVGLFYFAWLAQHGKNGPYDISKIVSENPHAIKIPNHPAWGPLNAFHHWGEPLFGYYTSDDSWVKRKHVQMLTDAGIDFLVVDATNASGYVPQVLGLMEILEEYRKQGWNVPKVVFYTNSNSGKTIRSIYDGIYARKSYPELWFQWEGKPLIIGHPEECDEETKNFFRIKKSQWPNEGRFHTDGFPWMAFERPQHVFKNTAGENEVINVSVAQHNGTVRFSSSAFYGDKTNRTRSFRNGSNDFDEKAYEKGYNFSEQFEHALKNDPKIIFFTGWNEWIAMRFNGPENEPIMFVDLCDANSSRDIEPMRGGYGDNYYMQLIECVRKFKGAPEPQNPEKLEEITIDQNGYFSWRDDISYRDYVNDTIERNERGYGTLRYTNTSGRNDFDTMKVDSDEENLGFYVQTVDPITEPTDRWMSLFIRIPEKSSDVPNWEGYGFVINRTAPEEGKAVLEESTGGWNWKKVSALEMKIEGNRMQIIIPKTALKIDATQPFRLEFKWADNYAENDVYSFYTEGDAAPIGRLNYVYEE